MTRECPFAVQMTLSSSIIVGRRLTLDAILASRLFQRSGDVGYAHSTIPLARDCGVWAGSAALILEPAPIRTVSIIRALRGNLDLTPDMIQPGRRGYPRIEVARGDYRNLMSSYLAHDAETVWFTGRGNIEFVQDLLNGIPAIGTKRSSGYGKVDAVHIKPIETADAGISFADGSPARPIPVMFWRDRRDSRGIDCDMALETHAPPYWNGDRELCVLPRHQVVPFSLAQRLVEPSDDD